MANRLDQAWKDAHGGWGEGRGGGEAVWRYSHGNSGTAD